MYISRIFRVLNAVSVGFSILAGAAAAQGDPDAGEKLWKKCKSCHAVGENAKKKSGPPLNEIFGRTAGTWEGFKFSKAMKAAGADGLVWDAATLDEFLAKPKAMIKKTKMSFKGFKDEDDRANVIAYLALFSGDGTADVEVSEDPEVAPEILALVGDVAYGQYLSGTCVACHRADGADEGIPSITGFPQKDFVTIVHAYKSKSRENPAMQQVAGSLSNEEIAALAAYFESL